MSIRWVTAGWFTRSSWIALLLLTNIQGTYFYNSAFLYAEKALIKWKDAYSVSYFFQFSIIPQLYYQSWAYLHLFRDGLSWRLEFLTYTTLRFIQTCFHIYITYSWNSETSCFRDSFLLLLITMYYLHVK